MGSMNNYKQLMEDRKTVEEKTKRLVLDKLSYLREVGRSVMYKTHGGYGWLTNSERELSYLGEELEFWLTAKNLKFVRLEEFNIIFEHPKYGAQNPNRMLSIPRKYLHMSDRDFAKVIRSRVKERKAYERKLAVNNATQDLKDAQEKLKKQQEEIVRLENLVEAAKEVQERKAKA
jgi:hypothetical protein